ncbi:MAG: hypothetical protein EOP47_06620 [Sphingobacteriaceae bacterium]|nr:MAG: hypothetical protein EOP47_06620 [Sphingobacteriaceae bacterium]
MNWLHYLLEANIYLGVFYVAYCLFLNKETHYLLNRLYLVLSSIVSFILPVLQLGILLPPLPEPPTASYFVAEQVTNVPAPIAVPVQVTAPAFTLQDGLWYAYLAGIIVCTVLLIIKLFSLFKLIRTNKVTVRDNYNVVYLKDTNTAFSFFNYLFIGTAANNERTILRHELVHIRQKHSADILFLEFLKIINWFNPLVYLLQNSLKTQHEYIADEQTVTEEADATSYSSYLVNNAYGLSGPAITHSFYNLNLLKNRIIMLHQKRSGNLAKLKYLVAVPIGAALLCASTLGFSKNYGWIDLAPQTLKRIAQAPPQQKGPIAKKQVKLSPPPPERQKRKMDVLKFPPPIVAPDVPADFTPEKSYVNEKGYKIEEGPFTAYGKNYYVAIISNNETGNKIGTYYKGLNDRRLTPTLQKYGYKFPDVKVSSFIPPPEPPPAKVKKDVIKFPPPIVKPDKAAPGELKVADKRTTYDVKPFGNEFMKFLGDNVRYPTDAKEKGTKGYVSAEVTIDDNMITNSRIINGIGNGCDDEVLRVLNSYKNKMGVKSGKYLISIAFNIVYANDYQRLPKIDEEKYGPVLSYIYSYGPKK